MSARHYSRTRHALREKRTPCPPLVSFSLLFSLLSPSLFFLFYFIAHRSMFRQRIPPVGGRGIPFCRRDPRRYARRGGCVSLGRNDRITGRPNRFARLDSFCIPRSRNAGRMRSAQEKWQEEGEGAFKRDCRLTGSPPPF